MLSDKTHYEFTSAEAPVSNSNFGASMWPRLEDREWLNELVRTAECRGGFIPGVGGATYSVGRGSRDYVATMEPQLHAFVDAITRLNAVMTVPYYRVDMSAPSSYPELARERCSWYSAGAAPVATTRFLELLEAAGKKVVPIGLDFTPGMIPEAEMIRKISDVVPAVTTGQVLDYLHRSRCLSLINDALPGGGETASLDALFTISNPKWVRDDGEETGPDDESGRGGPFLKYWPFGSASRHVAGCYFKAAWSAEKASWNNSYAYDGTMSYSIPSAPWFYSGGQRETNYNAAVDILVLWRVMHMSVWSDSTGFSTYDKYFTQRFFKTPLGGGLFTAQRYRGSVVLARPGTVMQIGDSLCAGVSGWPSYEPLSGNGSVIGYEVYVEPVCAVLEGTPARRDIGS